MTSPSDPHDRRSRPSSRRTFLAQVTAMAAVLSAASTASATAGSGQGYTPDQVAARDAENLAESLRLRLRSAARYQPLTGGIVHFFGYGQSLSNGFYGAPVLSTTQPYDNLMIGQATRAASNNTKPASTTWVPVGTPDSDGIYSFEPMIATAESAYAGTSGETPGEGAMNYLRQAYLQQTGLPANPNCRFVLTNCGIGGETIAALSEGASPEIFNRLRNAATYVQATATSLGLSYQVGGVIWTQGEQDVLRGTSYNDYLASFKALQQSFLTNIVQTIGGQSVDVVVPWVCHQPDYNAEHRTDAVYQALLDWSNTIDSDLYLAGPVYQYPDHSVHLTANGYRWHANQVGKALASVLLEQQFPRAMFVTGATTTGLSVLVNLYVPVPPVILGDAYVQFTPESYPDLGFYITQGRTVVPIVSAAIVGQATIEITLAQPLARGAKLHSGYNIAPHLDWGTNICDSDATVAESTYVYTEGVQDPGEDIPTWNGARLIGAPYPLNNYLAVGHVVITG